MSIQAMHAVVFFIILILGPVYTVKFSVITVVIYYGKITSFKRFIINI